MRVDYFQVADRGDTIDEAASSTGSILDPGASSLRRYSLPLEI
jgi:hypothetical protein